MAQVAVIKKGYVDTPSGQIHYRYANPSGTNNADRTIILLHKSASSSVSYEKIMRQLCSKGYRCYAPDMPGFGGSFDPTPGIVEDILQKGTRWYVDIFMAAFQSLGIIGQGQGQVHIIGHHSGACLATEIAAVYPELVASISLVGPAVMSAEERAEMKKQYHAPFNKPVADGSHLQKTWDYLRKMGVGADLELYQREAVDHIRAWKGRNLIYGAVWAQDMLGYIQSVKCPILLVCAKDDALWEHYENARKVRPDAATLECSGANFSLDLDAETVGMACLNFANASS